MGIINDYEELLIGRRDSIPKAYFPFDKKGNERVALTVIHYALETLLGWDVRKAVSSFNMKYIHLMKLDQVVKYIAFPSDVTVEDTEYILYLLYPRQVRYQIKKYTVRIYEEVLAGKRRYPKDYMYGYLGLMRAKICFQHAISHSMTFRSMDHIYSFFASPDGMKYLRDKRLYQLYHSFYDSPLDYLHNSLPKSMRNEFLYHNYLFEMKYNQLLEEIRLEEEKKKQEAAAAARLTDTETAASA